MVADETRKKLNLDDIARLSGYAPATISRTIHNHPNVSERARKKIMEVIEEYGYQPNPAAQALASQRSRILIVLIPHIVSDVFGDPFFHRLLQAVTFRANQLGYGVMLELSSTDSNHTAFYERTVNSRLADGFILVAAAINDALIEYLKKQDKPYLIVGYPQQDIENLCFVDTDNQTGAYLATQYLIQTGRQRIGTIPGRAGLTSTRDRLKGYQDALLNARIPARSEWLAPYGHYTEDGGYRGMQYLLDQGVDAVFCANDLMAIGAMRAINSAGLRIPQDIAVVGFDDVPLASLTNPPLTTIRQDINQLGWTAAEELVAILEQDQKKLCRKMIPVELVIRQSA
jgi:DNA-binding LacI/PurR family transcriptional regulator